MPDAAQALIDHVAALLLRVETTELLMEVDEGTGFARHFTHPKTGDTAGDKTAQLTTLLADGINLRLSTRVRKYSVSPFVRPATGGKARRKSLRSGHVQRSL